MATYNVDIWLPDASELGYPELGETSRKVRVSLDSALKDVQTGNKEIEIHFEDKVYKRDAKGLNIGNNSVAAISFSEDFAKKWSAENGNVAVLAMMGGELPSQKNFFRLGFSVETIAAILGDQVINDRRVSHVFLIRVKNELGEKFEEEFKRKLEVPSQNCSLDILEIDAKVSKDTKGSKSSDHAENNEDGNLPPTTHTDFVEEKEMGSKVESVISQWLSNYIQHRGEGLNSVVIYGYWEGYWDFVKEVLRCKDFKKKEDWLYVESNYPLFAPLHSSGGSVGINNKEFNKEEKTDSGVIWDVVQGANDNEFNTEEKVPNDKKNDLKAELVKTRQGNPNNALSIKDVVYCIAEQGGKRVKGNCGKDGARCFANSQRDKTVDPSLSESNKGGIIEEGDGLTPGERERVRCFTGKLMGIESSFNTFAREAVHLLWDAITDAHGRLQSNNQLSDCIKQIRKGVCKFLRGCKFYESAHLGSFFFRKDGELFFPLLRYNGELERGREVIVKESCCKEKELTKEAIADQLQRLSDSLNKVTGANIIPRDLEIKKDTEVANVFEQFSETIAKISNGIEIDFVSNYPNTKRIFYIWPEPTEVGGEKKRSHCDSIFDEACKTVKGVIQINLKDFDLEDNNAYRVYLVCGDNVSTLTEWVNIKEGTKSDVKAVFAKSRIMAGHADEGKNGIGDVSKFLSDFKGYRYRESAANSNVNFLYFIPEYISEGNNPEGNNSSTKKGTGGRQGGIFMTTRYKLSLFDLQIIENMVSRIFSVLKTCIAEHDALLSNIKSAIGSIMSRNGSHNIGSHVLAALSHNVGTMPDDRVLYQYIQHRMDYIATATTDFPTWRQPTMFLGTMMKTFLSQRHLLDHIAGSEGLKGWKFQDRNSPDGRAVSGNSNCLQFRIYPNAKDEATGQWTRIREIRKGGKVGFVECIDYDAGRMANLSYDVSLAIPGGTIGQHAFFTIIENIIRNAAKHDWSSPPEKKAKADNLEINIDFADIPEEGKVLFTISTNLSDVTETDDTSEEGVKLIDRINRKLSEPFIDSSGSLRRENWGLAEMKISAGYLQGREIGVIGGIESTDEKVKIDEERFGKIISAVEVEGGHLGYQFCVPKARTLLLVTDNEVGLDKDKEKFLASNGIFVKTKKEIEPSKSENGAARLDNSFEFVLVYNRQDEMEDWLPSRVVAASEPVETILEAIFAGTTTPKAVIDDVAAKYVKKLVGHENSLNLVVAPFHGGSGGGQSLINKAAAVAFVFENGFKEAVEAFNLLYLRGDVNGDAKQQELIEETRNALDFFLEKSSSSVISEELKRSDSKNYNELMTIQFKSWLEEVAGPDLPTIRPFIENEEELDENHPYQSFCEYFGQVCKQAKGYLGLYAEKIATLPQGFEYNVSEKDVFPTTPWVDAEMDITKVKDPDDAFSCAKHRITVGFVRHYEVKISEKDLSAFVDNPFVGSRSKFRYLEPLSGSQSYLVQMQSLAPDDRTFQAKLVECALTRILIVDERVSKFAATHSADIRATLALMGIRVADDRAADDALNDRVAKECIVGLLQLPVEEIKALRTDIAESENREVLRKRMEARKKVQDEFRQKFDVLIIHQGILDKWFRGLVDDKNKMSLVLAALREVFKQVIITTGRGTPANIPSKARVLPFSTIETTLFKKYPEKLILVDAIMNILPIHRN